MSQTITRDKKVAGLFVLAGKQQRSWMIQVDTKVLGKRKSIRKKIGDAETMGVVEARREAQAAISAIKSGKKPITTPKGQRRATVADAWASYEKRLVRRIKIGKASQLTLNLYRKLFAVMADWHDTELFQLATKEGAILVEKWHTKTTEQRGPIMANRAASLLAWLYKHAIKFDIDEHLPSGLPTRRIERNKEQRLSTGLSLGDLAGWNAARLALPNEVRREFALVTLLTGCRPGALKVAKWEDLDVEGRKLRVPLPKGGADRAFDLPMSRAILAAMARARRAGRMLNPRASQEFIFAAEPGRGDGHIADSRENFAHGNRLRQSYAGFARLAGATENNIAFLMNHSTSGDVARGYVDDNAMFADRLAAQEKISKYILQEMSE